MKEQLSKSIVIVAGLGLKPIGRDSILISVTSNFGGSLVSAVLSSAASLKAKACPPYCLDVEYVTCKSPGDEKLNSVYNCRLASKHCSTRHLPDGSSVYCN
ncbi:hypothetical protein QUC31_001400 [Theobroma cacao]